MIWFAIVLIGILYAVSEHRRESAELRLRSIIDEREPTEPTL